MSDQTQKRIEFIAEQLADLTAKQQQTDADINRLANAALSRIERIEGVPGTLAEAQVRTGEHVAALAQAQLRAEERGAETDERLNSLINVFERHISEGHKGAPRA